MSLDNIDLESHTSADENLDPQALIIFHLPAPFGLMKLNIPASEIAVPTDPVDPTTTTFVRDWRKTILLKTLRKIETKLDQKGILENNDHYEKLQSALEKPDISRDAFDRFFQFSVLSMKVLFKIYPSKLLQRFTDFYSNDCKDRILIFHLEFVGAAYRHLYNALTLNTGDPTTANFEPIGTTPTNEHSNGSIHIQSSSGIVSPSPISLPTKADDTNDSDSDDDSDMQEPIDPPTESNPIEALHPAFKNLNGVFDPVPPMSQFQPTALFHRDNHGRLTTTTYRPRGRRLKTTSISAKSVSFPWEEQENNPVTEQQPPINNRVPAMKPNIPWDSFQRSPYISSPDDYHAHTAINDKKAAYSNVVSWTKARFNPDDADTVIDSKTATFLPWMATHPQFGQIPCYPVRLNNIYMVREVFIASFRTGPAAIGYSRSDPKNMKNFAESFPIFSSSDVTKFFEWHNNLVHHGLQYGIFIPPARTLRTKQNLGVWFQDLTSCVQSDVQKYFTNLITGCLRSKMQASVRQDYPLIANIIQNRTTNGYKILYLLAKKAGKHPLLIRYPNDPPEPIQNADTTLETYINAWSQYLQYMLLDGTVYSDRYFMQQFQRNMHSSLKQKFGPHLQQAIASVPITIPLPDSFAPDELIDELDDHSSFAGTYDVITKTPRNLSQPSSHAIRAVQQISHYHRDETSDPDNNNDVDLPALIAAITQITSCYLCQDSNHKILQCPIYNRLCDNPRAIATLIRELQRNHKPSRKTGPPRHIRQIAQTGTQSETGEGLSSTDIKIGESIDNIQHHDDNDDSTTNTDEAEESDFL
jgi:hypothetical protein